MANLAIIGHKKRGKEVIEILEMLGGNNPHEYLADSECFYFYIGDGTRNIYYDWFCNFDGKDVTIFTIEEFLEKFPYKIGDKVSSKYLKNYEVSKMEWESVNNSVIYKLQGMGWYSADELQPYKEKAMEEIIKIDIPKGYEFAGVDDDNQQVVFTKLQPKYLKTYEECCKIIHSDPQFYIDTHLYSGTLEALYKLLICRNAYWKTAGEQMGLGKPWEPDWTNDEWPDMAYICYDSKSIYKENGFPCCNIILIFPTEEMRDAFYENFKDLIEQCKELL